MPLRGAPVRRQWARTLGLLLVALGSSSSGPSGGQSSISSEGGASSSWLVLRQSAARAKPGPLAAGSATEVNAPPSGQLLQFVAGRSARRASTPAAGSRVNYAAEHQEQELADLRVSNTCGRDSMLIELKAARPFYGLAHTLNQRRKLACTIEGDGGTEYKLSIGLALEPTDPRHCGVSRAAARPDELLSVVLVVRAHRNIELSDDQYFELNCTNRCRRPDCSSGQTAAAAKLIDGLASWRQVEREQPIVADQGDLLPRPKLDASGPAASWASCAGFKWNWLLALVLCLAIVLAGLLVSNCIICAALRRPSAAGRPEQGATQARGRRRAPRAREIEYDNRHTGVHLEPPGRAAAHEHSGRSHKGPAA